MRYLFRTMQNQNLELYVDKFYPRSNIITSDIESPNISNGLLIF